MEASSAEGRPAAAVAQGQGRDVWPGLTEKHGLEMEAGSKP